MEQQRRSRRRWAYAADLLVFVTLVAALSMATTGPIRAVVVWGLRVSFPSAPWLLLFAAIVLLVRHVVFPRPSILARLGSLLARPRTVVLSGVVAAIVCLLGIASAHGLRQAAEDRAGVTYTVLRELEPTPLSNCRLERFGEANDGGYLMCGNLLEGVKSAYSYGIAGYDKWGCDISRRAAVTVHEYDCFDPTRPSCPAGRLVFHDECVAGTRDVAQGRVFDTLKSQIERNGDGNRRLVLKLDVESAEWASLLATPDSTLRNVAQMAIEFHHIGRGSLPVVRKLKKLFYVVHVHFNNISCTSGTAPFPSWAYEVLLVNKSVGEPDRSIGQWMRSAGRMLGLVGPAPVASPLDAPNSPKLPDCQAAGWE